MRNFPNILFKLNFWIIILIAVEVTAIIFLCLYIPSLMRATLCAAFIWLLSAIAATVLFTRKGSPEVKCVWFVIITVIPVAGALAYLFASIKLQNHCSLKINAPASDGVFKAANELCGTCKVGYTGAKYFSDGAEFLSAAIEAVKTAQQRVYVEFYIIARGHVLNALIQAIKTAKERGAEIKIILDGVGSAFRVNRKDIRKLKDAGAEVKIFNKLTPFPHARINVRDHRKILTVDGKIAFTGGVNVADEYANITSPYGFWKDTGVAIYGNAAQIFEGIFLAMWKGRHEMDAPAEGEKNCLPFYDSPPRIAFVEELLINAISAAKTRIHILTPYLCLSDKTSSALAFAARRGVDVKIVIPHVPDKKYAFEVSKAFAFALGPCGIKFYEFTPGFMHAKTVICDDKLFIGSYNFDFRSTHFNNECGVMLEGDICKEVERDFNECVALSTPINDGKPSRVKRFYRFLLRFFAPLI